MTLAPRDQMPFMEMEARDEQQILAAIEGQVVTEFIYKVEGKIGLSLTGVNHMCFKMGHIKVDPSSARIEYDEREDEYTAYIVAINEKYELSAMGVSTQPRMMEIHFKDDQGRWVKNADGSWKMIVQRDRFAKTKSMSKAQRNAKRQVIPEAIIKAYLDYFMKLKEGKPAEAPSFEGLDLDQPPKEVKSEQVPVKEKPKARVGDPPRRAPLKPAAEKPKGETPHGLPESVEEVRERIADFIAGSETLLVVSDRGEYFRVGKRKTLDRELEDHADMIVVNMGGTWDEEANCWKIPKGVKD